MDNVQVRNDSLTGRPHNSNMNQPAVGRNKKGRKFQLKRIILSLLILLVVSSAVFFGLLVYRSNVSTTINSNEYQAVFFTNGQVYFGKLSIVNGNYMKLSNVFYIQTPDKTTDLQSSSSTTSANLELIKLGNEVHGPEDAMVINKDQVLFFENIKNDGKVTDSITKYYTQSKQ